MSALANRSESVARAKALTTIPAPAAERALSRAAIELLDDIVSTVNHECRDEGERTTWMELRDHGIVDEHGELSVFGRQLAFGACDSCGCPGDVECGCPGPMAKADYEREDQAAYEAVHKAGAR